MKRLKWLAVLFGLLLLGVAVGYYIYGKYTATSQLQMQSKDLPYYKNVWKNTFLNYQKTKTNLKDKGIFDLSFSVAAQGDVQKLAKLTKSDSLDMSNFSSLSLKLFGNYDFSKDINGDCSIKLYLNKQEIGIAYLDISVQLSGNVLTYYLNNLNKDVLSFLGLKGEIADNLVLYFEENKNKELTYTLPEEVINDLRSSLGKKAENSPLYQNSSGDEQKIIDSFLKNEVVDVFSGEEVSGNDRVVFKIDPNNFISFMNEVATIINSGDNTANFDEEREFFKNLTIKGYMDINNNTIVNSNIITELILKGTDLTTSKENYELLNIETNFKMPTLDYVDFDFKNTIFALSSKDNKLTLRIKGLIK